MQKCRTQYCKFEYAGYFNGLQVTLFFLFYRNFQLLLANILKLSRTEVKSRSSVPVDTGRKLNVHTTFRRRLGRLLTVLCTFNLRPVSTGKLLEKWLQWLSCLQLPEDYVPKIMSSSWSVSHLQLNIALCLLLMLSFRSSKLIFKLHISCWLSNNINKKYEKIAS